MSLALLLSTRPLPAEPPIVFKTLDPVSPNETALLYGGNITPQATAEGGRMDDEAVSAPPGEALHQTDFTPHPLSVLQATDLSAKVLIPADWKPGVFVVRVKNPDGASAWQFLNRPEIWWLVCGAGGNAEAGGEARICGLNFGEKSRVWLQSDDAPAQELSVKNARTYDLTITIPQQTKPGHYRLWVHNGLGGKAGFGEPFDLTVVEPTPWPDKIFEAKKFGAIGNGKTDDTKALSDALAAAQSNGGGIVFLPRGTYIVTAKLIVPTHTILRGESRDLVWLKVPSKASPIDSVLAGDGNFGVEDLSIVSQTAKRLITCPDIPMSYNHERAAWDDNAPSPGGVALRHLRLHHLPFSHRLQKDDPRRLLNSGTSTVALRGPDCEVSDCVIVSGGMPIQISNALRARILRNHLENGRNGWYGLWEFEYGLFEGNEIEGRDMEGTYGGVQRTARFLLFRDNYWHDAYGDEREALTFDSPYFPQWVGKVRMTDPQTAELLEKVDGTWPPSPHAPAKLAAVIVDGKGLGQHIAIRSMTPTGLTLESPWKIPPDESSTVALVTDKSNVIVADNRCEDASVFPQLYAQSYSFVISHNHSERTGGSYANAWDTMDRKGRNRLSYALFNQWFGNEYLHGLTYDQGPYPIGFLGCFISHDPKLPPSTMAIGNRFEGNTLDDMTDMGLVTSMKQPAGSPLISRDALFENNTWNDLPIKIKIGAGNAYTLIRQNQKGKAQPLIDDQGIQTLSVKPGH